MIFCSMNRAERAERLQRARLAQGLKQQDIATLLYKSLSTIKKWESATGAEPSNLDDLIRLCEVYGITVEWYLSGQDKRTRAPYPLTLTPQQEQLIADFDKMSPVMKRRANKIMRILTEN
ncbi:XRE family transcriptional regulator [Amphritea balenae]|uniref:XRE family transcriptional regulator n=2 Tax=Amphritea balenae TaxID=452629 RepID=A0A3P1SV67_9GAMM|nr:XRE family transcriptional regulator [Amphritea balenae]